MSKRTSLPTPAPVAGRGGAGRAAWLAQQKGRKAVLYVVKVYAADGGETFYKLGITFNLASRFSRLKALYRWRTVARFSCWDAGRVWDLEQALHARFAHLNYTPTASFSGFTECYAVGDELLAALPVGTFF